MVRTSARATAKTTVGRIVVGLPSTTIANTMASGRGVREVDLTTGRASALPRTNRDPRRSSVWQSFLGAQVCPSVLADALPTMLDGLHTHVAVPLVLQTAAERLGEATRDIEHVLECRRRAADHSEAQ